MMDEMPERVLMLQRIGELERELHDLRRRLVASPTAEELPSTSFSVVPARSGGQEIAFFNDSVRMVTRMAWLTRIPDAPAWVLGLLDLHGSLVPVIDLGARISGHGDLVPGGSRRALRLDERIVICSDQGRTIGLAVDEVGVCCELSPEDVEQPSNHVMQAPFVIGLVRIESRLSLLLSARRLVAESDLEQLDLDSVEPVETAP